jgi:hypothetical protein
MNQAPVATLLPHITPKISRILGVVCAEQKRVGETSSAFDPVRDMRGECLHLRWVAIHRLGSCEWLLLRQIT